MTALSTLLAGMVDGQVKRLSLVSEDTAYANAQPTTKTEFDFDGATWATDADVTVGAGSPNPEDTWGAAGISDVDGYTVAMAGGHGDSGRNAVMALDVQAAAANINGGGSGIAWARKLRGARFIAGALARPSSATSPTGAQQIAADPAQGPAYWTMPSLDGVAMPCVVHPWHSFKFAPGTGKAFCSGGSGFADNQSSSNAGFYWDRSSNTMVGPLVAVGGAPSNCTVAFGYVGGTEGPSSLAISILNGRIYTINNIGNFAWKLTYWTNPDNSSIVLNDTGVFDPSLAPFDNADAIIIPDPADPTKEIYFQHGGPQGSGTDATFLAISDINGSPVFNWQSYSGSSPTTAGPVWNHYAWDSKRGVIWIFDGAQIYFVTPSALGLTHWTISAALTLTGDAFTSTAGSGAILPSIQYVATDDALIVSTLANTLVVRPPNWSVPFTGPTLMQGLLLALWGTVGALPVLGMQGSVAGPQTFGTFTQTATMSLVRMLTAAQTIPAFAQTAALKLIGKIAAAQTIPAFTQTATLKLIGKLTAAQTIPAFAQAAALKLIGKLTAAQTVPAFSQIATMKAIEKINAAQTVPAFSQVAALTGGSDGLLGAQVIPAFAQAATLFNGTPVTTSGTDWLVTQSGRRGRR